MMRGVLKANTDIPTATHQCSAPAVLRAVVLVSPEEEQQSAEPELVAEVLLVKRGWNISMGLHGAGLRLALRKDCYGKAAGRVAI